MQKRSKKSPITFNVYEVNEIIVNPKQINICKELYSNLDSSTSIKERLEPVTDESNNLDFNFISSFHNNKDYLFGAFAQIVIGETSNISISLLDKKTASLNDMISDSENNNEGRIKNYAYFCIHNNILILSNAHITQNSFEKHINWLLNNMQKENPKIELKTKLNTATFLKVSDVKSIEINDTMVNTFNNTYNISSDIKNGVLNYILNDVKSLSEYNEEDILSATIQIKFKHNQKKEDKEKILNTTLKMVDNNNIVITDKKGHRISGASYPVKVTRDIEKGKNGKFNEIAIENAMKEIISKVENNEVVS